MHGDPLPVLRHRVARYQNDPSLSFWKLFKASKIWVQMVASKKPPPPRGGLPIVKTIDLPFSHTKWSEFTLRWRKALVQILIDFLLLMISLICVDQNGSQFLLSFSILNAAVYACQALLGENTLHACWFPNWLAADSKNWSSALNLQLRVLWIAIIAPERKSTKYHQKYCTEFPKKLRKQAIKPHKSQSLGVGFLWGKYVAS